MKPEHAETIIEVFRDVVRTLAFMYGEAPPPDEQRPIEADCLAATIEFSGPLGGTAGLLAPVEVAAELASCMRGEPVDPDDREAAEDALRELLNVLCGNLLTSLAGGPVTFDMGVPACRAEPADTWAGWLADATCLYLSVDEQPLLLRFDAVEATPS